MSRCFTEFPISGLG